MKNIILTAACIMLVVFFNLITSSCGNSPSTPTAATLPGSWEPIANFSGVARSGATTFVLDGKAYVGGGFDSNGNRLKDWWQFDPVKNGWIRKADFIGAARNQAVAFTIGNKAYVGMGAGANAVYLKDFYEFDPSGKGGVGEWKAIADFGDPLTETGRIGCIAFSVSGRGYVGAGYSSAANSSNDIWEYLPASDTWVQRTGMSFKRVNASVFTIGDLVYVVGGSSNGTYTNGARVEQYNPASDSWTQKLPLFQKDENGAKIDQPTVREYSVAFTIDGMGYIVGGSTGATQLGDTWQYNPLTDRWTQYYALNSVQNSLSIGVARDAAVGFSVGSFGYVTTGKSGSLRLDDMLKFNPAGSVSQ